MIDHYALVQSLTSGRHSPTDQTRRVTDFAFEMGWRPSDQLELPDAAEFTTGHLIVEHGLENTAVISFLRHPYRHIDLSSSQQKTLFNASYNNLVDWHINIDYSGVSFVYNRYNPPDFYVVPANISRTNVAKLKSSAFQELAAKHPSPDVPALDNALIATVSLWKRRLGAEMAGVANNNLSALFNALIFVRAVEDNAKRKGASAPQDGPLLASLLESQNGEVVGFVPLIAAALRTFNIGSGADSLIDFDSLKVFDNLERVTVSELVSDFYRNRYARYFEYDFSLMSKHALSRIYEHYVSVLRLPYDPQISLFPRLPEEKLERSYGNVYTPEFIARFFARYLRKELSLRSFQRLTAADPACGSGIFLRVLLELQSEALLDARSTEALRRLFDGVLGIDVDPNACNAARLSLSLLSLVLTDELPSGLRIQNADSLEYYNGNRQLSGTLDAVIANPPFVNLEQLAPGVKERVAEVLGEHVRGRSDLYLAILKIGLDLLKPDGFGMFVLPENFLKSKNAAGIRELISEVAWVRCLVDLTAVRVFEDVGAYVILLIFQKKGALNATAPDATVVTCHDFVGQALENVLDDKRSFGQFYDVFSRPQESFSGSNWSFAPPRTATLLEKFSNFPRLEEIAKIRLGMITGLDEIFVVPISEIARYEPDVFVPLLSDREMTAYRVPGSVKTAVFYPFRDQRNLDEGILKKEFPKTWKYLLSHRPRLEARRAVRSGQIPWWRPERPRQPRHMLQPKIVTPHLVLTPRFSLDAEGAFAISHTPYIAIEEMEDAEDIGVVERRDLLLYLLAILNSTTAFWCISKKAHTYERGYSRLEVATLRETPIPDFFSVDPNLRSRILRLTEARLGSSADAALALEAELDDVIAEAYRLTTEERQIIGLGQ